MRCTLLFFTKGSSMRIPLFTRFFTIFCCDLSRKRPMLCLIMDKPLELKAFFLFIYLMNGRLKGLFRSQAAALVAHRPACPLNLGTSRGQTGSRQSFLLWIWSKCDLFRSFAALNRFAFLHSCLQCSGLAEMGRLGAHQPIRRVI